MSAEAEPATASEYIHYPQFSHSVPLWSLIYPKGNRPSIALHKFFRALNALA
jgi:hypothetical protein